MGLRNILVKAIGIADKVTKDLQPKVKYEKYLGLSPDGFGTELYAAPVFIDAIVDWQQKQVRTAAGVESVSRAVITLPRPMQINDEDRFTLPDGTTGPILDMGGFVDRVTGYAMSTDVYLG